MFAEANLRSGEKTSIYFRLRSDTNKDAVWKSEPVEECIKGLYSREFLLFFGEELEYYFTSDTKDGIQKTDVKQLEVEESKTKGRTKYQLLNKILMAKKFGASDKVQLAAGQYLKSKKFAEEMFEILD